MDKEDKVIELINKYEKIALDYYAKYENLGSNDDINELIKALVEAVDILQEAIKEFKEI